MNSLQAHDFERLSAQHYLIGIDEAGRGCLAGPVVAGACVLSAALFDSPAAVEQSSLINDSKQLSAEAREEQYAVLEVLQGEGLVDFAVASGTVAEIAELNILGATRLAMRRAVEALAARSRTWQLPTFGLGDSLFQHGDRSGEGANSADRVCLLLVDGRPLKPFPYAHEALVKGDGRSLAIAMASIAAKVSRDRAMKELAQAYPGYGFEQHKGYGTAAHRAALKAQGATPIHRALFLRKVL